MLTAADPAHERLRAMKRLATGMLVLAAVVYLLARLHEPMHPPLGYLRAFCEAAMIGGLADWFAVTALFRHPLGVPLPHTAIIPNNKDRIGDALGRFVEGNFLSTEVVTEKLGQVDFAAVAAHWLADPQRCGPAANQLAKLLPRMLDAVGDEPMRHFIHHNFVEALKRIELAPLAADLLEILTAQNRHQTLVDEIILLAQRFLDESEVEIRARVREKTAWLWRRLGVDAAISDRLIRAAAETLAEVSADPVHAWRQRFDDMVHAYIENLRVSPEYRARVESVKSALLEHPGLGDYIGAVWDQVRARIRADVAQPDSRIRAELQTALVALGEDLLEDAPVQQAINQWLRRALIALIERRRHEAAALIADTVRRWDARTVSSRIEHAMGQDLQYIRINGTVIGGLVGVAIHALSDLALS